MLKNWHEKMQYVFPFTIVKKEKIYPDRIQSDRLRNQGDYEKSLSFVSG